MPDVSVSVVVATYNRSHLLPRLVDALAAQRDAPPFEVVVVDNGSTDDTPGTLDSLARSGSVTLRALRDASLPGPGPARNRGWRAAGGAHILFTDDDCVPWPDWVATLDGALADADVVQGRTVPNPGQLHNRGWLSYEVEVAGGRGRYETCNIAYRREVLERLDGFDESFRTRDRPGPRPPIFGEDVDLGWRAREAGFRIAFEPEAVVWHDVRPGTLRDRLRDLPRREGMVLALRRHPELRGYLESDRFYRRTHPHAMLAAAGIALVAGGPRSARRWAAGALLALPYARQYTGRASGVEWVTAVPRALALELAEIAVLVRASARHRTLLL